MKNLGTQKILSVQQAISRGLDIVLLIVSVLFLFVGIYAIVDNHLVIHNAEIPESLKQSVANDRSYPDIDLLKETNPEIIAWLTLDNTPVDYPITRTDNNTKYLTVDYKNKHSVAGNPFVDYRNDGFKDDYTIIYGHRMNQKKMFSSLVDYADASYMQQHLTGSLTTEDGTFALEVIAYSVENIFETKIYDIVKYRNNSNQAILKSLSESATTINGNYTRDDLQSDQTKNWKLLLLSTCDKDSKHYRDVVLLRIGEAKN